MFAQSPATPGGANTSTTGTLAAKSGPAAGAGTAPTKGQGFVETTGAALADCGTKSLQGMLEKIENAGGGVLFVDEVGGCAIRVLLVLGGSCGWGLTSKQSRTA